MLLRANSEEERQRPLKGSKKVKAQKPNKNSKVSPWELLYTHNHTNFENPAQLKKFVTWKPRLCLFSQTLLCQCVWRTKKKVFFLSSTTKQKPEEDQMQRGSLPAMENTIATDITKDGSEIQYAKRLTCKPKRDISINDVFKAQQKLSHVQRLKQEARSFSLQRQNHTIAWNLYLVFMFLLSMLLRTSWAYKLLAWIYLQSTPWKVFHQTNLSIALWGC